MDCPYCRSPNPMTSRYCGVCGGALDATTTDPEIPVQSARPPGPGSAEASSSGHYEPPDPLVGAIVADRYRVLEKVGQGGMGHVYKVEHLQMGKVMAMKVLHGELAKNKTVLRRFKREAQAASRLTNPHTVQVFDFGVYGPLPFLVMEYLRGEDMGSILRREKQLPFLRTAAILSQLCDSLSEAHDLGIVHRDLKPDNVLVTQTREGRDFIKVLDFGLAKIQWQGEPNELTAHGSILGTPYYMSPEQIRGQEVDARADIYSLGAMMYRVITGYHAFPAETPVAALTKHLTDDLVLPSKRHPTLEIPPAADVIIERAMQKNPRRRYQNVDEFKADLDFAASEYAAATGQVYSAAGPTGPSDAFRVPTSQAVRSTSLGPPGTEVKRAGAPLAGGDRGNGPQAAPAAAAASVEAPPPRAPTRERRDSWEMEAAPRTAAPLDADSSSWTKIGTRADWDRYENRLKRRRTAAILIPMLMVGGVGAGGFWWWQQERAKPLAAEVEPNNQPGAANPLTLGVPLEGHMGKRLSDSEADRDFYKIHLGTSDDDRTLSARVRGVPNINLKVEILDVVAGSATPVITVDESGTGGDELAVLYPATRSNYYVLITEVADPDKPPTENVSDPYTVFALAEKKPPPERDLFGEALSIKPGESSTVYAGFRFESLYLRVEGEGSRLVAKIEPVAGVDIEVIVYDESRKVLARVNESGAGAGEALDVEIAGAGKPYLQVHRKSGDSYGVDFTVDVKLE